MKILLSFCEKVMGSEPCVGHSYLRDYLWYLFYNIQCDAMTYNPIHWHTMQWRLMQCSDIQYNAVTYNTMQCSHTVIYNAMQPCKEIQYDSVWYNAMQYSMSFMLTEAGKLALKIAKHGETSDDSETILDQVRVWRSAWERAHKGNFSGKFPFAALSLSV